MQPPKIDYPYIYLPITLAKNIAFSLGHLWSLCTKGLAHLIVRINSVSSSKIKTPAPNPNLPKVHVSPQFPLKFPSTGEEKGRSTQTLIPNSSNDPLVEVKLIKESNPPVGQEAEKKLPLGEEKEVPLVIENELLPEPEHEILLEKELEWELGLEAESALYEEEIETLKKEYLLSLLPEVPHTTLESYSHEEEIKITHSPHSEASPVQLEPEPQIDLVEENPSEINSDQAKSPDNDFGLPKPRFRNRRNRPRNRKGSNTTSNTNAAKTKPTQNNDDLKPIIIEAGGGGNCQPLSFLKGLELQYPQLLKHEVNGKIVDYTDEEIRKKGVDFIRREIDSLGTHAETLLGYLDTDRHEFNDIFLGKIKEDLAKNLAILEKSKVKPATRAKLAEVYKKKYEKAKVEIEKKYLIQNDSDFLSQLEKPGFYCSTLHLFAYSILFDIPIHVYEQYGVPGHNIQFFNPNNLEKDPLCLYRVGNIHYQLLLFPKIAKP